MRHGTGRKLMYEKMKVNILMQKLNHHWPSVHHSCMITPLTIVTVLYVATVHVSELSCASGWLCR